MEVDGVGKGDFQCRGKQVILTLLNTFRKSAYSGRIGMSVKESGISMEVNDAVICRHNPKQEGLQLVTLRKPVHRRAGSVHCVVNLSPIGNLSKVQILSRGMRGSRGRFSYQQHRSELQ